VRRLRYATRGLPDAVRYSKLSCAAGIVSRGRKSPVRQLPGNHPVLTALALRENHRVAKRRRAGGARQLSGKAPRARPPTTARNGLLRVPARHAGELAGNARKGRWKTLRHVWTVGVCASSAVAGGRARPAAVPPAAARAPRRVDQRETCPATDFGRACKTGSELQTSLATASRPRTSGTAADTKATDAPRNWGVRNRQQPEGNGA